MTDPAANKSGAKKPFSTILPGDPSRILLGLREKWLWFIVLPLIFGTIGGVIGVLKTEDRYSVSLQLLRAEIPLSVQASQEGTAFKPRELSDETLLAVTYSNDVLSAVGKGLEPARSGNAVKATVEINKQRGTDFFYLTAHSRIGPEDAIAIVNLWAREIVHYTRDLQRREARDMKDFLKTQQTEILSQLNKVNQEILAFSQESEFYDAEKQTESYLSSLENLQMRLAEARIELQSKEVQIERYREELRNQSPLFEELRRQQKELTFLQGRYTEENPLVKEKLYEISHIQKRLEQLQQGEIEDLKEFTGSDLGNNLYLEILALENERIQLEKIVDTYDQLIESKRLQVASLPRMQMRLTSLNDQRQQLLTAQSLLDARTKEAEFYINNPPGYWKIFQTPQLQDVGVSSQPVKAFILGLGGIFFSLFIGTFIAVAWEFRQDRIRSPLQAAIAARTRPVLHAQFGMEAKPSILEKWKVFQRPQPLDPGADLLRFWLTELARPEQPFPSVFFQMIDPVPQAPEFWKTFLEVISQDGIPVLILPLTEGDRKCLPELPPYDNQQAGCYIHPLLIGNRSGFEKTLAELRQKVYVFIVTTERLRSHDFKVLQAVDQLYTIIAPESASVRQARFKTDVLRTIRGASNGLILLSPVLRRTIPRLLYATQMYFFQQKNREQA